jgi:hypothetical protein
LDAETLLRDLVEQIELGDYADDLGSQLSMNAAFVAARAWLADRGVVPGEENLPYPRLVSSGELAPQPTAKIRDDIARILARKS